MPKTKLFEVVQATDAARKISYLVILQFQRAQSRNQTNGFRDVG